MAIIMVYGPKPRRAPALVVLIAAGLIGVGQSIGRAIKRGYLEKSAATTESNTLPFKRC